MRKLNPEAVGLVVVNESDFYFQYAKPIAERHALLRTAVNADELAATLETDWLLLAEYAADFYRYRVAKQLGEPWAPETPELLAGLCDYLRAHYRPEEHDPQTRPYGGDLIKSVPAWEWASFAITPDSLGVIGGYDNAPSDASTTFHASAFRGKTSKFGTGPVCVSCSGGPASFWTKTESAKFSGRGAVQSFWRWKESPRANGGISYSLAVPVWECDLNR